MFGPDFEMSGHSRPCNVTVPNWMVLKAVILSLTVTKCNLIQV